MTPFAKTKSFRQSDSHLVFPVWQIIGDTPENQAADINRIARVLFKSRGLIESEVIELLEQLTQDGLVVQDDTAKPATFMLPNLNRSTEKQPWDILQTRDCYCYECHGHGEVLLCSQCPRVFHPECIRTSADMDMPLLPLREPVPDVVQDTFRQVYGSPYTKYRHGNSTPYPIDGDQEENAAELQSLCINCRMRKEKKLEMRDPTKLIPLLDSAFHRIRSWIALDTFSEQEPKSIHIPKKYVDTLSLVLFQKLLTANDIKSKIDAGLYKSLVDFQCDILDMVHCIGVLRGVNCAEYEAAKYLMLDSLHEIIEISNCQDCYEHSAVQDNNHQWFIQPCQPPHELVYAKQTGFSYWPAKVIRRTGTRVDVRFFGQQHTRAVINMRNVKPIDKMPSIKRSVKLDKAMHELAQHRDLLKKMVVASGTVTPKSTPEKDPPPREKLVAKRKLTPVVPEIVEPPVSIEEEAIVEEPIEPAAEVVLPIESTIVENEEPMIDQSSVQLVVLESDHPKKKRKLGQSRVEDETENSSSTFSDYQLPNSVDLLLIDVLPMTEPSNSSEASPAAIIEPEEASSHSLSVPINVEADTNGIRMMSTDEEEVPETSINLNGWENTDVDSSPPALGTPVDFQQYISNMEIAMIGCPQPCIDLALSEFRQYVRMVQAEMARHAEEVMDAKLKHFCCVCYRPASYFCCSATSYCTAACQSLGWNKGHNKRCKRVKQTNSATQTTKDL